ncbi:hypothetical protein MBAV_000798, partial [Candidatus Magnetobacterium bavaricum]
GDKHGLPEYIKQEYVYGTKHPYHRSLYEDNGYEEFLDLFFYCIPRDQDTQDCGQGRQQYHQHADAVDADVVLYVPGIDPHVSFYELQLCAALVEVQKQRQCQ